MERHSGNNLQDAAVLVPVYRGADGEIRIVLVRRTEGGVHGGQIAFPGGKRSAEDHSLADTALRETEEETGIERRQITVLETLPIVETLSTGFRIHPYLARVAPPRAWRPDPREVAELFELTVAKLLDPEAQGEELWSFPGWPAPRNIRFIRIGDHKLWGATYRILQPLLGRISAGEWHL